MGTSVQDLFEGALGEMDAALDGAFQASDDVRHFRQFQKVQHEDLAVSEG